MGSLVSKPRPTTIAAHLRLPLLLAACALAASPLGAQVPTNDTCANAIPLLCGDLVSGSTVTATPESLPFCGTSDGSQGAVWYSFIGTGEEIVVTTCEAGTDYDTKIRVYTGGCGALACVGGDDDEPTCSFSSLRSRVSFFSSVGVEYLIVVHGFGTTFGNFEMSLTCVPPPTPDPNDLCLDAELITAGSTFGSTPGNDSDGDASCGGAGNSPSVWYRFVATDDLTLRARTCNSPYDSVVSIHSGCPGDLTTELACSDNGCGDDASAEVMATTGVEYWIRVAGNNGASGDFTLLVDMYDPSQMIGPDVVYTDCTSISNWGQIGGTYAYSLGSFTCNIGDENLLWGTNTPLLGMNAYRLANGRIEQIGMSWMKRGTGAAAGNGCGLPCNGAGGSVLGAGCRDVYGSGFNGSQSILGPRSQVNAWTGDNPGSSGSSPNLLSKRLQITQADLSVPGAIYFVEGVYVAPDDAAAGNAYNNASYKRVTVNGTNFNLTPVGGMHLYSPALEAWADHGLGVDTPDPSVTLTTATIPGEGTFHLGAKVTDLGGGQFLYDYAIFNLNSHRSAGSFSVPLPAGASVSGIGFHDVDHHSGEPYDPTDWSPTVGATNITWSSPETFAQNPDSNALRFGTMYNFWFECDVPPATATTTLGIFRPGTPDSITIDLPGPESTPVGPQFVRGDCNTDTLIDIADAVFGLATLLPGPGGPLVQECRVACDSNDDGAINIADPIYTLALLFTNGAAPPPPYPACGMDLTPDALDCTGVTGCP